jgi:hypothetical protein
MFLMDIPIQSTPSLFTLMEGGLSLALTIKLSIFVLSTGKHVVFTIALKLYAATKISYVIPYNLLPFLVYV